MNIFEVAEITLRLPSGTQYYFTERQVADLSISANALPSSSIGLGGVNAATLDVTFVFPPEVKLSQYEMYGATLDVSMGRNNGNHGGATIQKMGIFNITKCKRFKNKFVVSASDNMILLDTDAFEMRGDVKVNLMAEYMQSPHTIFDIFHKAVTLAGLRFDSQQNLQWYKDNGTDEHGRETGFFNADILSKMYTETHDNANLRDWVRWCAECMGGFAYANSRGEICIERFARVFNGRIEHKQIVGEEFDIADYNANAFSIQLTTYDGSWFNVYTVVDDETGLIQIDLKNNPIALGVYFYAYSLYDRSSSDFANYINGRETGFLWRIWNGLVNHYYQPFDIQYLDTNYLVLGGSVDIRDSEGNIKYSTITSYTLTLCGTQQIQCAGEDTRILSEIRKRSKFTRQISELKTEINFFKGQNVSEAKLKDLVDNHAIVDGQVYYIME